MYPAYLLLGPETGQKSQFIKTLRDQITAANGEAPEIHRYYPFETEQDEILVALQNSSLFANHRLVLLSQADTLSASQVTTIAEYLKRPSATATLIIVSNETSISKKIDGLISKEARQVFWEMFEDKKRDWIESYIRKANLDISDDAIEMLLELVENNTNDLKIVCDQLIRYFLEMIQQDIGDQFSNRPTEISPQDIDRFIYHSRREHVLTLFEKIAYRDLPGALEILSALRLAGEAEPAALYAGLLWQFRRLYSFIANRREGLSDDEAYMKARVLERPAAINGKRNRQIYREAAKNYLLSDIEQIIMRICDFEGSSRSDAGRLQDILVELFLYTTIGRKGAAMNYYPELTF